MEPTNKRFDVFGLFFGCPEIKPLKDCPIQPYREGPALEKLEILENLSDSALNSIISRHRSCLLKRIQQNLKIHN